MKFRIVLFTMATYSVLFVLSIFVFATTSGASLYEADKPSISTNVVSNNIYDCINPTAEKVLLYSTTVNENSNFLSYRSRSITFPNNNVNSQVITCIVVTDNDNDGTGGYPSITSGGISSTSVEISLRSQWNRGLHFSIRIYADAASSAATTPIP